MSQISSRTPEGIPNECPLCGAQVQIEPSTPAGDAPCPNCGGLLWFHRIEGEPILFDAVDASSVRDVLRRIIAEQLGVAEDDVSDLASFTEELGADSLDTVELVMQLEEEFDLQIRETDAARIQTIAEAIAYILRRRLWR